MLCMYIELAISHLKISRMYLAKKIYEEKMGSLVMAKLKQLAKTAVFPSISN